MKRPAIAALVVLMLGSVVRAEEKPKEAWERIVADYFVFAPKTMAGIFAGMGQTGMIDPFSFQKAFMLKKPIEKPATLLELETKFGAPDKKEMVENVRIPRDADQRSELMSITIPK